MTNAIWMDEKTGTVRVATDRRAAANLGNGGFVFTNAEELAASMIPTRVLVDVYNNYAGEGKTITKFADRATAANRTFKAILIHEPVTASKDEDKVDGGAKPQPTAPSVPATTAVGKKKPRGAKGNRSKKIFPVVINGKGDPYRSGKSAATWKMIVDNPGKTFAEYVAMGGRTNTIAGAIRDGHVKLED